MFLRSSAHFVTADDLNRTQKKNCFVKLTIWQALRSSRWYIRRRKKDSKIIFPLAGTMRVSRFTCVGTRGFVRQNLSRHARGRGARGNISVNASVCCEKHRNDVYLPSLLYIVTLSRVSRESEAKSRSGRSVSWTNTLASTVVGSKTKTSTFEKQAISHRPQKKSWLSGQWRYRREASLHIDNSPADSHLPRLPD